MSTILNEVLIPNQQYSAAFGDKANLALPPARRFAVLTCMDARLDPAKFAGLAEGDAKTRHAKLMGSSTLRVRTIAERSRLFSE
jgi:carbonic anhydrase